MRANMNTIYICCYICLYMPTYTHMHVYISNTLNSCIFKYKSIKCTPGSDVQNARYSGSDGSE